MKTLEITRLELVGFGKFRERTIDLTSGLNLIEGPNEAGKSTIQSFITGMFYGFFQPGQISSVGPGKLSRRAGVQK